MTTNKKSAPINGSAEVLHKSNKFLTKDNVSEAESVEDFPIDVFPIQIQEYFKQAKERKGFDYSYIGLSYLCAVSTAIGGKVRLYHKNGWRESAQLYGIIVGDPSAIKSHPLSEALSSISKADIELMKQSQETESEEPVSRLMVTDATIQALGMILNDNPFGLIMYQDEMAVFFERMTTGSSNDRPQYLEMWNRQDLRVNRVTRDFFVVPEPYLTLVGTIQYETIIKYIKKDSVDDGFFERFLYATKPERELFQEPENNDIDYDVYSYYINSIKKQFEQRSQRDIQSTDEFSDQYRLWKNEVLKEAFHDTPGKKESIVKKLTVYVLRFSLILFMLDESSDRVDTVHLHKAIKLFNYFKKAGFEINELVSGVNPLDRITDTKKRNCFEDLPDDFDAKTGLQIFINHGYKRATFFSDMKKYSDLFDKSHNSYERRF